MEINVSSEINRLKGVIVHTPGKEVTLVNPDIKDSLLFDDIIFESDARYEHLSMLDIFKSVMPKDGEIFEIADLIYESFKKTDARSYFIEHLIKRLPELNLSAIEHDLLKLEPNELLEFAIWGQTDRIKDFNLMPSPNILFTRDLAAIVNDGIIISRAAKKARARESLLMETIVDYHPMFQKVKNKAFRLAYYDSIEGGDILVVNKELVIIGMSERTSFSGIMKAAKAIFSFGVKNILIVDIPKQRSSMHLDTIFTFANTDECIVYPPAIIERDDNVVCLTNDGDNFVTAPKPSLKSALRELTGRNYTFIKCGGEERINQNREQWTDGANVFALAPGVIVGYERNTHTFATLQDHGYTVMNQFEFVEEYKNTEFTPSDNIKLAISFTGNELCRGRGGARCMTLPLIRNS
ncbi:MAG TPA: arginine deiminase family protein [Balneolales bacterium]|nr:arginine deiminase family protein [Balneolales bacterium]